MSTPRIATIAAAVCACHGIEVAELLSRRRHRQLAWARQEVAWLARQLVPRRSYAAIGRALGGRDTSTVRYAIRQVEWRLAGGHGQGLWWLLAELQRTNKMRRAG